MTDISSMDATLWGILLAVIASLGNILGAYLTFIRGGLSHRVLLYLIAGAAGYLLAWMLTELFPHLILARPNAGLLILAGYMGIYLLENLFASHAHQREKNGYHTHALVGTIQNQEPLVSGTASWAAFGGLLLHTFFDGAGIMASFQIDSRMGLLLFLGVMIHKIPEGTSLSSILLAAQRSRGIVMRCAGAIALSTILGALSVLWLGGIDQGIAYDILGLSAGMFLFVGASNLIPATQKGEYRSTFFLAIAGALVYFLCAWLLGIAGLHHAV